MNRALKSGVCAVSELVKIFLHLPWNAGKGDCGHYNSHLGFSVLMGRGFIKVGGWSREEPGEPPCFSRNLAECLDLRLPPLQCSSRILDTIT